MKDGTTSNEVDAHQPKIFTPVAGVAQTAPPSRGSVHWGLAPRQWRSSARRRTATKSPEAPRRRVASPLGSASARAHRALSRVNAARPVTMAARGVAGMAFGTQVHPNL